MCAFDISSDPTGLLLGLVLFGFVATGYSVQTYRRYRSMRTMATTIEEGRDAEGGTIVAGPVSVTEPATPEREPTEVIDGTDRPALVAWRIRRHVPRRRGSTERTIDGGLAVGEFAVRHGGRYVQVPEADFPPADESDEPFDPFDDPALDLDEPATEIRLGEPDSVTKVLERLRLLGENGLLSDGKLSSSARGKSKTPDRYEVTVVADGDEVAIEGELTETRDGPVLRRSGDDPLTLAIGNLEERGSQLRSLAFQQLALGIAAIAVGVIVSEYLL